MNASVFIAHARDSFRGMVLYKYEINALEAELSKRLKVVVEQFFAKNIHKQRKQFRLSGTDSLLELSRLHKLNPFLKQFKYVYLVTDSIKPFVEELKSVDWFGWYHSYWDLLDPRIIYFIENTIKPERTRLGAEKTDPDEFYIAAQGDSRAILTNVFVEVLEINSLNSRIFIELYANELPAVEVTHLPVMINDYYNTWELKPISVVATEDFYPESLISLFASPKKKEQQKVDSKDTMDILISAEQKLK